jgi:hypothetical protein
MCAVYAGLDGQVLRGDQSNLALARCPHCGIANPLLGRCIHVSTSGKGGARNWHLFACSVCGGVTMVSTPHGAVNVLECYPSPEMLDSIIPARPREYLTQAKESISQPIGSIVCAAGAVDAMLKAKGLNTGSLNARIDEAASKHLITAEMGKWAHQIRLDANDQRHADENAPLPTTQDAERCYDFAVALAQFLFVLPARVTRGIQQTQAAPPQKTS